MCIFFSEKIVNEFLQNIELYYNHYTYFFLGKIMTVYRNKILLLYKYYSHYVYFFSRKIINGSL